MKEPCIDCPSKVIDDYGYFCDLACGKRSAWENYMAGVKEVVGWLGFHYVVRPNKDSISQFEPYYMITISEVESKLKVWGL